MTDLKHIRKSFFELLIRVLFVVLPTMAISGYVLNKVNLSYTGFDSGTTAQFIFLFAGILLAYVLAWMNGRFLVLSVILLIIAWLGKVIVENMAGELDLFYAQAKYFLLSTLFVLWRKSKRFLVSIPHHSYGKCTSPNDILLRLDS